MTIFEKKHTFTQKNFRSKIKYQSNKRKFIGIKGMPEDSLELLL
jgi:hypothetical protein